MAREEKERLEKLEEDRKRRMQGVAEEEEPDTHKSADDLDDGWVETGVTKTILC